MRVLYDTNDVHPLDRFAYYQEAATGEFAPVQVGGPAPSRLAASMRVDRIGDLMLEMSCWSADTQIEMHRTSRLVRAADPECFRVLLSIDGGFGVRQGAQTVAFSRWDVALYDTSRPWRVRNFPNVSTPKRTIMLTFPRSFVPPNLAAIERHVGTVFPRRMRARGLIADLLLELTYPDSSLMVRADVADVAHDCVLGLLGEQLGRAPIAPQLYRDIRLARIQTIIRSHLSQPELGPAQIAAMAHISTRSLYQLLHAAGTTPMALVKHLRLDECRRRLGDPTMSERTIRDIAQSVGYRRQDQFARDFRQQFGISARKVRP